MTALGYRDSRARHYQLNRQKLLVRGGLHNMKHHTLLRFASKKKSATAIAFPLLVAAQHCDKLVVVG